MMTIASCKLCFDELEECKEDLGSLWLEMCNRANCEGFIHFKPETYLLHELWLMEQFGYIISRDIPQCIQVKILGRYDRDDWIFYCIDKDKHHD